MCLDIVSDRAKKHVKQERNFLVGWKYFSTEYNYLMLCFSRRRVKVDQWIKDTKDYKIPRTGRPRYQTGFHIYLKAPNDLFDPYYRKVYYKKPVAWGYQDGKPVVVARELFIIRKRRRRCV